MPEATMDSGLISVLLPYRNAEATLARAVEDVLAQQDVTLELLAIDDGSSDDGPELVRELAARDPRVVALHGGGVGIAAALTVGLAAAGGAWIARMDADDGCDPRRLSRQLALLAGDRTLGAVGTQVRATSLGAGEIGEGLRLYVEWQNSLVSPEDHARELFVESPLCHPSVLMRRDVLERVGGFRSFDGPEDYDLWLRMHAAGFRFEKVPEVLFEWRHLPGRLTFSDPRCAPARFLETKAPFIARELLARRKPFVIRGAGPTGKELARELEKHGARPQAFLEIDPRKIGRSARGAPIYASDEFSLASHTLVVAVGARGARKVIQGELRARGVRDEDVILCA